MESATPRSAAVGRAWVLPRPYQAGTSGFQMPPHLPEASDTISAWEPCVLGHQHGPIHLPNCHHHSKSAVAAIISCSPVIDRSIRRLRNDLLTLTALHAWLKLPMMDRRSTFHAAPLFEGTLHSLECVVREPNYLSGGVHLYAQDG